MCCSSTEDESLPLARRHGVFGYPKQSATVSVGSVWKWRERPPRHAEGKLSSWVDEQHISARTNLFKTSSPKRVPKANSQSEFPKQFAKASSQSEFPRGPIGPKANSQNEFPKRVPKASSQSEFPKRVPKVSSLEDLEDLGEPRWPKASSQS
jgi:hypothetical protein